MQARTALLVISAPAVALFLHCSGSQKPVAQSDTPAVADRVEAGVDAETGAGGSGDEEKAPPRPDPAIVKKAVDRAGESAADETKSLGIRFEVVEMGPHTAWGMAVINRGNEPVRVVFDPRLLVLEVEPPPDPKAKKWAPKPKTRICRLPDELRPARAEPHFFLRLEPGRGMVESFDPRLYCLPEQGVSPLVAGARVTARFGWAPKTKTVWKKGKREEEVLPQLEPFVAEPAPPLPLEHEGAGNAEGSDAGKPPAPAEPEDAGSIVVEAENEGVKELRGTLFELGADYAPPSKDKETASEPMALELKSGSDALNETQATVTLAVVNHAKKARQIYFRREFVSFEVSGADGIVTCDPQPDGRAPDRQAFTLLAPGGSLTSTSRLVELCPDDTFARPGLYVVNAELNTFASGAEFGFDAFVGRLVSERSVVVRIRSGSLPFPGTRAVEEVKVGGTTP